jgi:hypothetical protein
MIKAVVFAMMPLAAQAGGWGEFQARCVDSFENMSPPIVDGLAELPLDENEAIYMLGDQQALVLELAPEDGEMACRLEDQTGQAGLAFDTWITEGVKSERYEKVGDGHWQSHEWVEPVVAVQKWDEGGTLVLRILVTDLES